VLKLFSTWWSWYGTLSYACMNIIKVCVTVYKTQVVGYNLLWQHSPISQPGQNQLWKRSWQNHLYQSHNPAWCPQLENAVAVTTEYKINIHATIPISISRITCRHAKKIWHKGKTTVNPNLWQMFTDEINHYSSHTKFHHLFYLFWCLVMVIHQIKEIYMCVCVCSN